MKSRQWRDMRALKELEILLHETSARIAMERRRDVQFHKTNLYKKLEGRCEGLALLAARLRRAAK